MLSLERENMKLYPESLLLSLISWKMSNTMRSTFSRFVGFLLIDRVTKLCPNLHEIYFPRYFNGTMSTLTSESSENPSRVPNELSPIATYTPFRAAIVSQLVAS